jgi:transposase
MKMRSIRQILHYRLEKKLGADQTACALKISKGTVINTVKRFEQSGLPWPLPEDLTDSVLESRLYPATQESLQMRTDLPTVDYIEQELAKKHVTLQCLYEEYRRETPEPVSRAAFYRYYNRIKTPQLSMAVEHKGGDLVYVDYSGDGLFYTDAKTGVRTDVELFCCCWGLSSYSFAEATETQQKRDFCQSHVRAFRYFGVCPHGLVPDNLKSAVTTPDPFDPKLNPLYEELGRHYNAVILPARSRKPKDKAKVESAVLHIQRYILAHLRNRQFFSLSEINKAVMELLEEFNDRPMKDYGSQTRRERFTTLDQPYAQPLPEEPFRIIDIRHDVLVGKNYHVRYLDHFYSVPYEKVGKRVLVRRCSGMIEIFHDGQLLTRHLFGTRKFGYSTKRDHMPAPHQFVKGLTPGWIIAQAAKIGENTVNAVGQVMRRSEHIQQGFNAALGVLGLARAFAPERLEKACQRCIHYNTVTYRALKSVLAKNLDQQPIADLATPQPESLPTIIHENLRLNFDAPHSQLEEVHV